MTRFAPPQADPHGLRDAARRLTAVAGDLEVRGRRVATTASATLPSWQGSASLLMAARARELQRATQQKGAALADLARATDRYADDVDRARDEVRRLNELWDEAVRRAQLQAAAAAAEREARAAAQRASAAGERVPRRSVRTYDDGSMALAETQAQLEQRYRRLSDELEQDGFSLQRALSSRDPVSFLPPWVAGGVHLGQAAVRTATTTAKAAALVRYSVVLRQTARYFDLGRQAVSAGLRSSAEHRALVQALHGRTWTTPVAGQALTKAGKVFLPLTLVSGLVDVGTGGGHDGWLDAATRVAGGVGVGGAGALLLSASPVLFTLTPVGLAVAGAAVLAYSAWSIGTSVYENAHRIAAFGARVRGAAVRGAVAWTSAAARTVAQAQDVLARGAVESGRYVVDVLTSPTRLVPRVAGLF